MWCVWFVYWQHHCAARRHRREGNFSRRVFLCYPQSAAGKSSARDQEMLLRYLGTSQDFVVLIDVDISCVMRWTSLKGSRGSGAEQGAGGTQAGLMVIIFCVSAFMESKHCVRTSPGCCWLEADHKMTDMFWSCNLHQHHLHLYTLISDSDLRLF